MKQLFSIGDLIKHVSSLSEDYGIITKIIPINTVRINNVINAKDYYYTITWFERKYNRSEFNTSYAENFLKKVNWIYQIYSIGDLVQLSTLYGGMLKENDNCCGIIMGVEQNNYYTVLWLNIDSGNNKINTSIPFYMLICI